MQFLSQEIGNLHGHDGYGPFEKTNYYSCFNHRLCGTTKIPYRYINYTDQLVKGMMKEGPADKYLKETAKTYLSTLRENTVDLTARLETVGNSNLGMRFEIGTTLKTTSHSMQLSMAMFSIETLEEKLFAVDSRVFTRYALFLYSYLTKLEAAAVASAIDSANSQEFSKMSKHLVWFAFLQGLTTNTLWTGKFFSSCPALSWGRSSIWKIMEVIKNLNWPYLKLATLDTDLEQAYLEAFMAKKLQPGAFKTLEALSFVLNPSKSDDEKAEKIVEFYTTVVANQIRLQTVPRNFLSSEWVNDTDAILVNNFEVEPLEKIAKVFCQPFKEVKLLKYGHVKLFSAFSRKIGFKNAKEKILQVFRMRGINCIHYAGDGSKLFATSRHYELLYLNEPYVTQQEFIDTIFEGQNRLVEAVTILRDNEPETQNDQTFPRRGWTEQETTDLINAVIQHGEGSWVTIANDRNYQLEQRNNKSCREKWRNLLKSRAVRYDEFGNVRVNEEILRNVIDKRREYGPRRPPPRHAQDRGPTLAPTVVVRPPNIPIPPIVQRRRNDLPNFRIIQDLIQDTPEQDRAITIDFEYDDRFGQNDNVYTDAAHDRRGHVDFLGRAYNPNERLINDNAEPLDRLNPEEPEANPIRRLTPDEADAEPDEPDEEPEANPIGRLTPDEPEAEPIVLGTEIEDMVARRSALNEIIGHLLLSDKKKRSLISRLTLSPSSEILIQPSRLNRSINLDSQTLEHFLNNLVNRRVLVKRNQSLSRLPLE